MNEILDVNNSDLKSIDKINNATIHSTFKEIYQNHKDNLSQKWEHYFVIYQDLYQKFRGNNPNILEIGVENGGGLQITSKYFINGNVYGIDINPKVCEMDLGHNIKTYCFDINDKLSIQKHFNDTKFDIILDDGSHINSDIIKTFKTLFSQVKPGGIYIVEDMHTSYWNNYGGGYLKKDTAIEFFKGFIDLLNAYYIAMGEDTNFIRNLSEDDSYVFEWLESIVFYDSVVAIKKLKEPRTEPYKQVTTGIIQPIIDVKAYLQDNNNLLYRGVLYQDIKEIENALDNEANIDFIHEVGGTALYIAAENRLLKIVHVLLEAGANTEIKAINDLTPLYASVQNNDIKVTKLLLEYGAYTETSIRTGSTPLFVASYFGYDDILQLLLENGANKSVQVQGISAFMVSLQQDHLSTAIILAGSTESFCHQIQNTEYEVKYSELCGNAENLIENLLLV